MDTRVAKVVHGESGDRTRPIEDEKAPDRIRSLFHHGSVVPDIVGGEHMLHLGGAEGGTKGVRIGAPHGNVRILQEFLPGSSRPFVPGLPVLWGKGRKAGGAEMCARNEEPSPSLRDGFRAPRYPDDDPAPESVLPELLHRRRLERPLEFRHLEESEHVLDPAVLLAEGKRAESALCQVGPVSLRTASEIKKVFGGVFLGEDFHIRQTTSFS